MIISTFSDYPWKVLLSVSMLCMNIMYEYVYYFELVLLLIVLLVVVLLWLSLRDRKADAENEAEQPNKEHIHKTSNQTKHNS